MQVLFFMLCFICDLALLMLFVLSIKQFQRISYLMLYFLGIIILWIGGIIPSLYANIYEDVVKLILPHSPDNQPNPWYLLGRALVLLVISIIYIVSITCCTPVLIKKIWKEITIWFKSIDLEELARNPLVTLPPRPRITTAS